jgi:hypothetical protein
MLQVNQLVGFGAGEEGKSYEWTDFQTSDVGVTNKTWTCNIGTPGTGRIIVVSVFGSRASGTPASITAVTINGVSATVQASVTNGASITAHYTAVVPTGTSATILVDYGQQQNRVGIGVWALYGFGSATATDTSTDNSSPFDAAGFDVQANGVAIGSGSTEQATSFTWTGLTEDFDGVIQNRTYTGASEFFTSTQTSLVSSVTPISNSNGTGVWSSYA